MKYCQVQHCNNKATQVKTEEHENYNSCVVQIVKTETLLCENHAELISNCESSSVTLDTF